MSDWIDEQMEAILAAAETELTACGNGHRPCFTGLIPGDATVDGICDGECGQLTLRLLSAFKFDSFPVLADAGSNCSKPLAYSLELRMMRCFEAVGPDGEYPTAAESAAAVRQQNADMMAMLRAINCRADGRLTALDQFTPNGPQGNYTGGQWTFTIAEDD